MGECCAEMSRRNINTIIQIARFKKSSVWHGGPRISQCHLASQLTPEDVFDNYRHQQRRYYKNFGHKPQPGNWFTRIWYTCVVVLFVGSAIDWNRIRETIFPKVDAATQIAEEKKEKDVSDSSEEDKDGDAEEDGKKKKKKEKVGFRDRKIIEYENRIRSYSTPDKIFRYFATVKIHNLNQPMTSTLIYMTPDDFLRAITPDMQQPDGKLQKKLLCE
ncbi:Calcium uptake protein 1 [Blattella germanica]|nr:Calcium uptake protein 1 [Blattella germanica]